ncbi:DedA family protein [Paenibacillus aurantius]|uniref:DedA family protein n=1 Tax=Paenibacillus aurantius TaxID=2918900 RepID=A0AA96LCU9_9BACL|nr:DedA family protein [Paenibacillus aurantius]WNQ11392.1 DedA family protein [Paenibacillus aurantius]
MENWITSIMDEFGYAGIFLLIMLENLFPPIPSEVILTFGGFMTTSSTLTVTGVVIASTLGSVVGALLLYAVGRLLDVNRLERIVIRYGRILRLTPQDIRKADAWFSRYGAWTVLFCRLVPLVRSLISIPAGSTRMNLPAFLVLTTVGSLIWNLVLVRVGAAVGGNWEDIVAYMDVYSNIVYAGIVVLAGLAGFLFLKKRYLRSRT